MEPGMSCALTSPPSARGVVARGGVPAGVWVRCDGCGATLFRGAVARNLGVCTECDRHLPISAPDRIAQIVGGDGFEEWDVGLRSGDPLGFRDHTGYGERVEAESGRTGLGEAAVVGMGRIGRFPVVVAATDPRFMMGSMGSVVGEKLTRAIERAAARRLPLVLACSSSGARLHEGIFSLMQMAKVSAALARHHEAGAPSVSVLADPSLGGVASVAMLGDVILAEPGARVGYTPPALIAQMARDPIAPGFQTSEFLMEHGFIDRIVHRRDLRATIAQLLDYLDPGP